MKNYFEHEIEVKYCDGILNNTTDWQWLICEIENEFSGYTEISTWEEFMNGYRDISSVYSHLVKINSILNATYKISLPWLKQINKVALMYDKKIDFDAVWKQCDCTFTHLLALVVYSTVLQNICNEEQFLFSAQIFTQNNAFEILKLDKVNAEKTTLIELLATTNIKDLKTIIGILSNNLDNVFIPARATIIDGVKESLLEANAFNYQNLTLPKDASWEDYYLVNMVKTKIKDRKLIPLAEFNGRSTPDISLWTPNVLDMLRTYFNCDVASFIIDTIKYVLYKSKPSVRTVEYHFELVIDWLNAKNECSSYFDLNCSSLQIIQYLIEDKFVPETTKSKYMKNYVLALQRFKEPQTISHLIENEVSVSKEQKLALDDYYSGLADTVEDINNIASFLQYCENRYAIAGMKIEHLKKLKTIFLKLIQGSNSVDISYPFYSYMTLLLDLSSNNNIDVSFVKNEMISTQLLWQNEYYDKCVNSMQVIEHSFSLTNDESAQMNNVFLTSPVSICHSCMPISKNGIMDSAVIHAANPMALFCQHITINKAFPMKEHFDLDKNDVDKLFLNTLQSLMDTNGYKLLNHIEAETMIKEIYRDYIMQTQLYMSIFNKTNELYNQVSECLNGEYELIDINNTNISLAHLTQLFPILENKIRDFGMRCGIVPFKEKRNEFMHVKDASSVLRQIILEIYEVTGDLFNALDFFFIYQCMYNGNCLNIRNECSHGRDFLSGSRLVLGLKTTLLCLKLIQNRLADVR